MLDPITTTTLAKVRQNEMLQEAENRRRTKIHTRHNTGRTRFLSRVSDLFAGRRNR